MNRTSPKPLRTTLVVMAVVVAVAAALALALLTAAQWLPDEISSGRIQWDDHSIALSNAFSGGLVDFMFAFGLMTLAMLISFAAMVFAATVTVVVLTVTAGMLALVAGVIALPFLLIVGIAWWIVRRNRRNARQMAITNASVRA